MENLILVGVALGLIVIIILREMSQDDQPKKIHIENEWHDNEFRVWSDIPQEKIKEIKGVSYVSDFEGAIWVRIDKRYSKNKIKNQIRALVDDNPPTGEE